MVMTRRIMFLMTTDDEREFSERLCRELPGVTFLEGDRRELPRPIASIDASQTSQAWIHERPVPPRTTWEALGPLIQVSRSYRRDSVLESLRGATLREGSLAIAFESREERDGSRRFVDTAWRVLRGMTTNKVKRVNPASAAVDYGEVNDIHIAAHAIEWERRGGLLAATTANIYFRPLGDVPPPRAPKRRESRK
jgi:hypothetical protein